MIDVGGFYSLDMEFLLPKSPRHGVLFHHFVILTLAEFQKILSANAYKLALETFMLMKKYFSY